MTQMGYGPCVPAFWLLAPVNVLGHLSAGTRLPVTGFPGTRVKLVGTMSMTDNPETRDSLLLRIGDSNVPFTLRIRLPGTIHVANQRFTGTC